jgi:hypothetical protein
MVEAADIARGNHIGIQCGDAAELSGATDRKSPAAG